MDEDEHIFYSPLSSTKAQKPYIVLGFTPIKRFSQLEVSPKSKGTTQTVQQKTVKEERTSVRKEVQKAEPVRQESLSKNQDFTIKEKISQLKEYLKQDVNNFERDDNSKLDRLTNLHRTYYEIIESQSESLDKLWGDKMKNMQGELSKGNDEIKKKTGLVQSQIHELQSTWDKEVKNQNDFK